MAPDDGARTLTLEGRRGVRRVGGAARTGKGFARMLASLLPRAVQTAGFIAAALAFDFYRDARAPDAGDARGARRSSLARRTTALVARAASARSPACC